VILSGCGKQGPPLAPLTPHPARISDLTAHRIGETVYLRFTIPNANQDGTTPADLERVDVYAFTSLTPTAVTDLKDARIVSTVLVRRPPTQDEKDAKKKSGQTQGTKPEATPAAKPKPPKPPEPGMDQGAVAVVSETLGADTLVPVVVKTPPKPPRPVLDLAAAGIGPMLALDERQQLSRYYVAVGVSRRGRKAGPSQAAGVPLVPLPPAAGDLTLSVGEKAITIAWAASEGSRTMAQPPGGAADLTSRLLGVSPPPPLSYNVYLRRDVPPVAATPGPPAVAMPTPLNEKPVSATSFDDEGMEFGKARCYVLRVVETVANAAIEGEKSKEACVTPLDTFPPPAPAALAAVASEGAISLIWEGVETPDFAGYLVLRGEAPGGTLVPITPALIRETTYRDATAKRGVRYVYAVVAVDNASPPNRSALSNKVEEAIR
jgi:hypothetical protein